MSRRCEKLEDSKKRRFHDLETRLEDEAALRNQLPHLPTRLSEGKIRNEADKTTNVER